MRDGKSSRLVTIASIPMPLRFGKGEFESGVAAKRLALYVADPLAFLEAESKQKMAAASRMLWFKFEELAFKAPATAHWREARSPEADNIDVGPVTEADLHNDLFRPAEEPF